MHRKVLKTSNLAYTMLLVQGRISQKNMAFNVPIGCVTVGSQGIVVKCTAAIFFRKVDYTFYLNG